MMDLQRNRGYFPIQRKFNWIFRRTSLLLTIPMAQKSKPSAKPKKAVKPAPAKAKAKSAPVKSKKPATANHKPAPKVVAKAVKVVKPVKAKPISNGVEKEEAVRPMLRLPRDAKTLAFFDRQKKRLLELRDHFLDQMQSVAQDSLRSRAESNEASAVGQHQADAGSDAYEKDFALSLLSQEQDALYEIEEALKRIEGGAYGVCEMSNKAIPHARLEAIPFARFTVECQQQLEKENRGRRRWDTAPQFMDSAEAFADEEEESADDDDKKKEKD
jgi:RNA polymerase-binding transcription factor DksA